MIIVAILSAVGGYGREEFSKADDAISMNKIRNYPVPGYFVEVSAKKKLYK